MRLNQLTAPFKREADRFSDMVDRPCDALRVHGQGHSNIRRQSGEQLAVGSRSLR